MQVLFIFNYYSFHLITVFAVRIYIIHAREMYDINEEQSLTLLLFHKFNVDDAYLDLTIPTTKPSKWTIIQKAVFHRAYEKYGKDFSKIQELVYGF